LYRRCEKDVEGRGVFRGVWVLGGGGGGVLAVAHVRVANEISSWKCSDTLLVIFPSLISLDVLL